MKDTENLITTEGRAYFTIIPNLVDDRGLSVYAFRLYVHIVRVVGWGVGGRCWQSTRTLAKHCKMSVGKVVGAKKELAQAGLIKITHIDREGTWSYDECAILDIWQENARHYREDCSPGEQGRQNSDDSKILESDSKNLEFPCSPHGQDCSPGGIKQEPNSFKNPGQNPKNRKRRDFSQNGKSRRSDSPANAGGESSQPRRLTDYVAQQKREARQWAIDTYGKVDDLRLKAACKAHDLYLEYCARLGTKYTGGGDIIREFYDVLGQPRAVAIDYLRQKGVDIPDRGALHDYMAERVTV